jgi:hypothetical protein
VKMVSFPSVVVDSDPSSTIRDDDTFEYHVKSNGDYYFNLESVCVVKLCSSQPEEGPVSLVRLISGSFLTLGTPQEVCDKLNNMANRRIEAPIVPPRRQDVSENKERK